MVTSMVANTARDPKRQREPFQPEQFMPHYEREPTPWEDMLEQVKVINAAMGGKDLRQNGE